MGIILHEVFNAVVKACVLRHPCDPIAMFEQAWAKAVSETEISYSSVQTPESLLESGRRMAEIFQQSWKNTGLVPIIDDQGEPVLEREFKIALAPGLFLMARIDILCMSTLTGQVGPIDFKTPAAKPDPIATVQSDQLSIQQIVLEPYLESLGLERIDTVGFLCVLRRPVPKTGKGKGPEVLPPSIVPARSRERLAEARQDIAILAEDIERGRFRRTPRQAYNSPCEMCDYAMHCTYGSMEGLVVSKPVQQVIAA